MIFFLKCDYSQSKKENKTEKLISIFVKKIIKNLNICAIMFTYEIKNTSLLV